MNLTACCCNLGWFASQTPAWNRFAAALKDPAQTQQTLLLKLLRSNAQSDFGRQHGFSSITSVREFRAKVPLAGYEEYEPWVARLRAGEPAVLTSESVRRLAPTSGSSSRVKLIPYTDTLRQQFAAAIGPWICDLFRSNPAVATGRAFWSVTPNLQMAPIESKVPVGFDEDTDYLGDCLKPLVQATLAVPESVSRISNVAEFRRSTLVHLLNASDLRLVSVWHPSFFMLLLDAMEREWHALLEQVRAPSRRKALRDCGPADLASVWPRLRLVSCWADGPAALAAASLQERVAHAKVQPKGLLSTEAVVTLPFAGTHPLAVRSHFFEFVDERQELLLAEDLQVGSEYSVVATTGGGLYRYRLGDRVRVTGRLGQTPCLAFVGREKGVVDLCGEKLHDHFVAAAVQNALECSQVPARFVMLVPERIGTVGGYTLFIESESVVLAVLTEMLEQRLRENPHYALCVSLGQLRPVQVERVRTGAFDRYLAWCAAKGMRLGNVKPAVLSADTSVAEIVRGLPQP